MSAEPEITIWISAACTGSPGYGGWAWVALGGPEIKGQAGGDRRTTVQAMAAGAVTAALQGAAGSAPVLIRSESAYLVEGVARPPFDDQPGWLKAAALVQARAGPVRAELSKRVVGQKGAFTFVDAWAAFAQEKVKTTGAFAAPIPKSNLRNFLSS